MPYIASFDIGTTQTKGILLTEKAVLKYPQSVPLTTIQDNDWIEQDPQQWFSAVCKIVNAWFELGIAAEEIVMITFSGQMQDCIPIDVAGQAVRPAILYADGRASKQAERILAFISKEEIRHQTGNHLDGTLTFPKILWLQEEEPEIFKKTDSILISSKDYVIRQLTGVCATDPTSAATTGMMNLRKWQWQTDWFTSLQVPVDKLPMIYGSDQVVGKVTPDAAKHTGLLAGTPVMCGIGDAGAASLGAGVTQQGDVYAYIGTSGWMAMLVNQVRSVPEGIFHLAYLKPGQYLIAPPITNAGSVHRWASSVFSSLPELAAYDALEQEMQSYDRKESDLLFLPYLNGERYPVQDPSASGVYLGIHANTTRAEMCCAALEGVAMAMKQGMEQLVSQDSLQKLTLIGGGSKSRVWNQIFADVLGVEVQIPSDPEVIPAKGAAAFASVHLGWCSKLSDFVRLEQTSRIRYQPNEQLHNHLAQKYKRYVNVYPALQNLF